MDNGGSCQLLMLKTPRSGMAPLFLELDRIRYSPMSGSVCISASRRRVVASPSTTGVPVRGFPDQRSIQIEILICLKSVRANRIFNMPRKLAGIEKPRRSNVERARQYLTGGGVTRDDSDDELGLEDHPWHWVYAKNVQNEEKDITRKSKHAVNHDEIVGARMGEFECRVGDCVLLKAERTNEAWIGIICNFEEEEDDEEKSANFMWFSTEKEIRNKRKKRTDAMQVGAHE